MANKPLAPPDYIQRFRLFLAMPVGIIGYEFTCCWQSRDRVLLITKVRKCLEKWGYSAKDVPCLGFRGWVVMVVAVVVRWVFLCIYIYISGDFNLRSVWFARMLFLMIGLGGRVCGLLPDALGIPPLRKSEGFQQGNQGNPFSII